MASYAPLFAHVDGWQWTPDMIWVDNLRITGTANYYVQKLYATNRGTHVLPTTLNNAPLAGQDSLYASSSIDKTTNEIIIKIVNTACVEKKTTFSIEGVKKIGSQGTITVLTGDSPDQMNSLDAPYTISPVTQALNVPGKKLDLVLEPCSFNVIRIPLK